MTRQRISRASYFAALAAATLVLAGCGREPYPTPSEDYAPPPPPPGELLGAPEPEPVPPPPPEPTPAPTAQYPGAQYPGAQSAPVIIAMAPIPNPPEPAPRRRAAPQRTAPRAAQPAPRYVSPAQPAAPRAVAPARPAAAPAVKPAVKAAPSQTARITPPPSAARPAPAPALKPVPTPATKAPAPASNSTSPIGDRSTRLASLETTLTDAIGRVAKLTTPDRFVANQPAEVTLTVPAEFAQTLRDEAAKNDLADAATSVNLTAVLSGDGFAVTPDSTQSRPLVEGQPTEFQWTVTAQQGGAGPLHAELGADLLGAGSDTLSLGSVQSGGGLQLPKFGARAWGFAILALIAAVVIGLLSRGRGSPSRSAAARREGRRARTSRPMSFSESEA